MMPDRARQPVFRLPGAFRLSPVRLFRKRDERSPLRRFLPMLARHWKIATGAGLVMIASVLLQLPAPLLTKYLVDEVVAQKRFAMLHWVGVGLVLFLVLQSVFTYLQVRMFSSFRCKVLFDLQSGMFEHLERLPVRFFEQQRSGAIVSRLTADVNRIRGLMASNILSSLKEAMTLLFGIGVLFWLDRSLAWVSLGTLPFYVVWLWRWNPRVRASAREVQQNHATLTGDILDSISGIYVIKSFLAEGAELGKALRSMDRLRRSELRSDLIEAFVVVGAGFISTGGKIAIIWLSCWEIMHGRMTLGTFLAFNSYLRFLFDPSKNLITLNSTFQQSLAALDRVYQLLDEEPEPREGRLRRSSPARGRIEFRNVSFSYDGTTPVLSNVSFTVEPGRTLGVVGPSGSGKTTLIKLLLRYYEPESGEILLDGVDIRQVSLEWLRAQVSVVFQDPFLFGGDILGNLRLAREEASLDEIVRCCQKAGAHEFIERLPDRYATRVGERGVSLSGGQVQRLSIARALLKSAPVLILDEATASLDASSEKAFRESVIDPDRAGSTLIIAHRLSTVRRADSILVLEHGRVIEMGRHEELLEMGGCYRKLFADFSSEPERAAVVRL